jgi:hypothetical protein
VSGSHRGARPVEAIIEGRCFVGSHAISKEMRRLTWHASRDRLSKARGLKRMADLRVVPAAIVVCVALLAAAASDAADKIQLICEGSREWSERSNLDKTFNNYQESPYSLTIDLDRKIVNVGIANVLGGYEIPVTKVADNYIWFNGKAMSDDYWEGTLDRITGDLTLFHRSIVVIEHYYSDCKPAKPLF